MLATLLVHIALHLFLLHSNIWVGPRLCNADEVPYASTERETWMPHIPVAETQHRNKDDKPLEVADIADILR